MALPIAHATAGYLAHRLDPRREQRESWRRAVAFLLIGNLPDVDFLFGFVTGAPDARGSRCDVRRRADRRRRCRRGGPRVTGLWPLAAYVICVGALFVRVADPGRAARRTELVATADDVRLVRRQHRIFYALL